MHHSLRPSFATSAGCVLHMRPHSIPSSSHAQTTSAPHSCPRSIPLRVSRHSPSAPIVEKLDIGGLGPPRFGRKCQLPAQSTSISIPQSRRSWRPCTRQTSHRRDFSQRDGPSRPVCRVLVCLPGFACSACVLMHASKYLRWRVCGQCIRVYAQTVAPLWPHRRQSS
jgi:hypothetical protein